MSEVKNCCLCYKELHDRMEENNPAPLRKKDKNGEYAVCCLECNGKYVIPARMTLWPGLSRITEEESEKLIARVQNMPVDDIKEAIEQGKLLERIKK